MDPEFKVVIGGRVKDVSLVIFINGHYWVRLIAAKLLQLKRWLHVYQHWKDKLI